MNPKILCISALLTALSAAGPAVVAAQGTFEGVITVQADAGPRGPQDMQFSFKGGRIRLDLSAQGMEMYMLFDRDTKVTDMVIPARKMAMERTIQMPSGAANQPGADPKVEWTGKKETIAGHECEHATITEGGTTTDACLAKGLGSILPMLGGPGGPMGGGTGMSADWQRRIGDTFPLKVVSNGQAVWTVTKVEKKSLDDSLFTVPDGYQKMGMPGGGFGGPGGR